MNPIAQSLKWLYNFTVYNNNNYLKQIVDQ